jgi:hypothetical protein
MWVILSIKEHARGEMLYYGELGSRLELGELLASPASPTLVPARVVP